MAKKEVVEEEIVEEVVKSENGETAINFDAIEEVPVSENQNMIFADRVEAKKKTIKNPFVRVCYSFVMFIAVAFLDFIASFKRNPIKIGAWLIAIPGVFIGFLMNFELDTVYTFTEANKAPLCMFILVLCGMINIFEAFSITKNRDFASILIATVLALVITVSGVIYILDINKTVNDLDETLTSNAVKSFITIGGSILLSIVGVVIAWIFRDKNYKKDKF